MGYQIDEIIYNILPFCSVYYIEGISYFLEGNDETI
jgi:hypothetical protein